MLGEFPDQAEDTLIRLSDVEAAAKAGAAGHPEVLGDGEGDEDAPGTVLSVDVARFGSDRSVILRRRGQVVEEIRTFHGLDTMQLTGWVAAAISEWQPERVAVDEIGVGAGVVDRLKELGHPVSRHQRGPPGPPRTPVYQPSGRGILAVAGVVLRIGYQNPRR